MVGLTMNGMQGAYTIDSVQVNSEPVMDNDGFEKLIVAPNQVSIEPAGIEFVVNQSTSRSAILESRSQVFFAEYSKRDGHLTLDLSRPAFRETIRLSASLEN